MRKRILWIQTGGTFSCAGTKSGLAPQSSKEQAGKILALMPQVCEKYDIVPMTLMNIDSSDMTISDQKRIADTIGDNIGKYDGIVITHGTDTMAYTAAALSVRKIRPCRSCLPARNVRSLTAAVTHRRTLRMLWLWQEAVRCAVSALFSAEKLWTEEIVPRLIPYRITLSPV